MKSLTPKEIVAELDKYIIGQDAAAQVINQVNAAIAKQSLGEVLTAVKGSEPVLDEVDTGAEDLATVSYTHLRAHETVLDLVCRLLLEKKNNNH